MIRVVANISWLVPGSVGGSEEYTVRLLEAVIAQAPADIDLRLIGSDAVRRAHPALATVPFDPVPGPMRMRVYRIGAESSAVYRLSRGADVVHHFGGRVPARHHGNDIVTIHDLQPLQIPDNFSPVKRRYLAWVLPRSARTAQLICTPSQWVAETITNEFGISSERLRAVPSTYALDDGSDPQSADAFGSAPVVLYPAVTHPHKNHAVLIDAVDALADLHPGIVLVLTGAAGRADAEVAALAGRARVEVVRPGRVAAPVLQALLRRADVLAFPSRYEGFGLPVLEAMHIGTPVVAADATALPEVVGDAAVLVDPADTAAWASAIGRVLSDADLAAQFVEAGRARAATYAPERAAHRLIDAWRSVG